MNNDSITKIEAAIILAGNEDYRRGLETALSIVKETSDNLNIAYVGKRPEFTEFCIRYIAGNVEVKYTREFNSKEAIRLMEKVDKEELGSGLFYRHVC